MQLLARARFAGRFALAGAVAGGVGVLGFLVAGRDLAAASETAFALAALVFGFALVGWSASVFAGRGIENMQKHLDTGSDWTETDSRQAMVVLASVGGGGMVGVVAATMLLGTVL